LRTIISIVSVSTIGLLLFAGYWYSPSPVRYFLFEKFVDISSEERPLGGNRPALVHLPDNYDPSQQWPMLLSLHGYLSFPAESETYVSPIEKRNELNYIIVSPKGTLDRKNNLYWDATPDCCAGSGEPVDDVSYLRNLIYEAKERYSIDPERIFVFGISNGGYMAYKLACENEGLFRGSVVFAGLAYANEDDCKNVTPQHIVHFHGTNDKIVPIEAGNRQLSAPTETNLRRWAIINRCDPEPELIKEGWEILSNKSHKAELWEWQNCEEGSVRLIKLLGAGHIPWFSKNPILIFWPWLNGQ